MVTLCLYFKFLKSGSTCRPAGRGFSIYKLFGKMEMNPNSLLAPDYIRESNNFIMEYNFMENQIVFPKNHFFQLVNKTEENAVSTSSLSAVSSTTQLQTAINETSGIDLKHSNSLLPLEEEYEKPFSMAHVVPVQSCEQEVMNSVQSYPSLPLLAPANVISEPVVPEDVNSYRFARKALPHKKRISRKLKSITTEEQDKRLQFTCEICGHCAGSQLHFFSHLKEHYEPTSTQIIASLRTTLDDIEDEKNCAKKIVDSSVEQVFNDVHLHFADFPNDVSEPSPSGSNLKLFNPVSISKCIDFENGDDASLKNIVNEEIEFSDTEDMLEGIRNVVDKVSIEDSCDDIDLIASTGLREHWFNNNNFQRIETSPLKSDVSFPGAFAQILDSDDVPPEEPHQTTVSKFQSTVKDLDAQKLIDFSTICPEKFESTNDNQSINNIIQQNDTLSTPCHDPTNLSCVDDTLSSIDDIDCQISNSKANQKSLKTKEKYFYCEECKREFNSGNALKYHKRTHTGIRPHKCNVCDRSFFAHSQKITHMRTHTGEKPFQCEFCQQRFRQWGDLKYHTTSIHTEEKSHQCEFCGKAFSRKYSLVLHIRIHENERNYKCDFCDKAFRASSYLQNHRRIHTGEKPHECKVCSKRFRVYGDLRRHMRIHQRNIDGDEDNTSRIQDLNTANNEDNSPAFL